MRTQRLGVLAGKRKRLGGAALIIALCFLVIISAVVLAIYNATRSDLVNSKVYVSGQATILLTDTAVNLVEGQITTATTKPQVSWASQPGMIHAYDTSGVNTAYKLYSSDALVVSPWGKPTMTAETAAMDNWKSTTDPSSSNAQWCDLNAPAVVNRTDPTNPTSTVSTPVFPIVDPGAMYMNNAGVVGFGFSTDVAGTSVPTSATDANRRLPMPVKWIYVLKNGQLIAPSTLNGTVASFTGTLTPTKSNPIIGRIAFWADDDTCKLNINTASEGTFWDMPRAVLPGEWYFPFTVPILGEFQAIGGHPATTCLDPVLGDLMPRPSFQQNGITQAYGVLNVTPTGTGSYTQLQSYYALNPRITDTAWAYNPLTPSATGTATTTSEAGTMSTVRYQDGLVPTVVYKTDRLYATADELLFRPDRNPNANANGSPLTTDKIAQRDFFITAQSRAPETTLFGTPRISLWPIQQTNSTGTYQSARDQLINYCATVGGSTYSFQRGQVSQVGGVNQPNPAYASVSADWNITRNQSLFSYATSMMESTVPGFGSSLGTKWGNPVGCERMMTMVMDFIRSGLSQVGTTLPTTAAPNPNYWCYRADTGSGIKGAVIPLQVTRGSNTYNGMGRNWSVCSAAIQVIATSRVPEGPGATDGWGLYDPEPPTTGIQAALLLNFYNPMPTCQVVDPSFRVRVTNVNGTFGISVNGTTYPINGSTNPTAPCTVLCQDYIGGNQIFMRNYALPGFYGLLCQSANSGGNGGGLRTMSPGGTGNAATDEVLNYPFLTQNVPISGQTGATPTTTFNITGGSIKIEILEGGGAAGGTHAVVQTETLNFPAWTGLPLPQSAVLNHLGVSYVPSTGPDPATQTFATGRSPWFQAGDIVGEVQLDPNGPTKGDYRLLTMESIIPTGWFTPNAYYGKTVLPFVTPDYTNPNADAAASMQNRFAFAFQNTQNGTTWGPSNGKDSPLGQTRWGPVATTGIAWNGPDYTNASNGTYTVNPGGLVGTLKFLEDNSVVSGTNPGSILNNQPIIPPTGTGWAPTNANGAAGDWSAGLAWDGDGAILSAPDTATWSSIALNEPTMLMGQSDWVNTNEEAVTEPNRVVPSPIILGSLPTPKAGSDLNGDGVLDDLQPWQSLLLCPNPSAGSSHPGFGQGGTGTGPTAMPPFTTSPPDHLFIDLFWMPVVEPYAISDPLSTAGKVNLNYEMEPFTHITRRTALVGVLTPVDLGAVSNTVSYDYKLPSAYIQQLPTFPNSPSRFTLNLDTTTPPGGTPPTAGTAASGSFSDFETRFTSGDIFRSASEVCMIRLVPTGQTMASYFNTWWSPQGNTPGTYQLTGMNMRESPYNQIYSRITTKSNTYTVYYRVQALQQVTTPGRDWTTWDESKDVKSGEYRGSTKIERYLDPNTPGIPDYTQGLPATGGVNPIDSYYSWRVVSQKQFAPGSN
jgi:uncharacterized protein (TIGR02600 family)